MDNLKQHKLLLQQIHDTYIKKKHDYGDSFSCSFKKYGLVAAMVHMEDKWNRLDNMANVHEKIAKAKESVDEGEVMALYKAKWSQAKIADGMVGSQGRISQIIKAHKE